MNSASRLPSALQGPVWWHLLILLGVSVWYESLWIHAGINHLDETWPLYAAMKMQAGGTLYEDVLWVFPPAHVWTGWLAYWLDPPGIVLSRIFYGVFDTALVVAMYAIARRLMPSGWAFLTALILAIAAPRSHAFQLLFGYRYLVFTVLALLAFSRRLGTRDERWMYVAGAFTGLALAFRLTPAFAAACAIGIGALAAQRDWRVGLADCVRFAGGLLLVIAPFLVYFSATVGLPRLWHEVVLHPLGMLQPLPPPDIVAPVLGDRRSIYRWFVAIQFRAQWFLFGGFLLWLGAGAVRARLRGQGYGRALPLAVTVWGTIYFIRSLGRSDEAHLDSAVPPAILLTTWFVALAFRTLWPAPEAARAMPRRLARVAAQLAIAALMVGSWVYLLGTDIYFDPAKRGKYQLRFTPDDIRITSKVKRDNIGRAVKILRQRTKPSDTVLMLGPTPMFHVFSRRLGPGYFDTVMPGTFMSEDDELGFIERLEASPPGAVVWTQGHFDKMPERSVWRTAPRLTRWVQDNYHRVKSYGRQKRWIVMVPNAKPRP